MRDGEVVYVRLQEPPVIKDNSLVAIVRAHHVVMRKLEQLPDGKLSDRPPRTDEIEGITPRVQPAPGEPFKVYGKPLDPNADVRLWLTSMIVSVEPVEIRNDHEVYRFRTQNSVYEVEDLGEA
jgi:hypothetical protein